MNKKEKDLTPKTQSSQTNPKPKPLNEEKGRTITIPAFSIKPKKDNK